MGERAVKTHPEDTFTALETETGTAAAAFFNGKSIGVTVRDQHVWK